MNFDLVAKQSLRLLMNPMREMLVLCRNVHKLEMVSPTVGEVVTTGLIDSRSKE